MILQIPLVWIALICLFIGCLLVIGLLTLLVVAFVLYKMWFGRTAQMVNKIPCQPRHPLWGHLSDDRFKLGNAGYEWFLTNANIFHGVFAVWLGPWTPVITPCRPEEIEDILKSTEPKGDIYNFLKPWMGKGLLINEGSNWFKKRRMITPAFHFDILKMYVEIFSKNTLALADDWEKKNQIIDLQMDMTYLSLDNIGECAFGVYFNAIQNHDSPFVTATLDASDQILQRWINPLYYYDFIFRFTPLGRKHAKTLEILHTHSIEAIRNRRKLLAARDGAVEEKTKYFIDILLTATDEEGTGLTDEEIKNEVDTFMFEGHDTTSSGLMWTFYAISQHPEVEEKIVEELNEVLGEKQHPDFQDLKKLNYLTMVVKESHRMFPPVPGISRTLTKDTKIGDFIIPSGSQAYIVPPAIHMNDMIWPEPTKFDPLRFTTENSKGRHAFAYVPFSAGPRNCIGQNFALAEEKTVVATLLKKFKFTYVGEKITPQPLLTLRNEGPLLFHLTPRNKLC